MNTIIYSKYSNERNRKFAVRTDILEEADGRRWVRKTPEYPEGEAHVQALYDQYQRLSSFTAGTKLAYDRCRLIPGGAELEYITGISLEDHLLSVMKEEGMEMCAKEFLDYLNFVRSIHVGTFFKPCEEFCKVFGTVELPLDTVCSPCTNIDLLCENILLNDGKWTAIDYEWSFSFPIPVNFLLFRIIFYFTAHADRGAEFERFDFYGKMGISPEEIVIYERMETNFQQYVCYGHVPIRDLYEAIGEGFFRIEDRPVQEALQVYFDFGEGFREEHSKVYRMNRRGVWSIRQEVPLPENVKSLRVDPGYRAGMVHLKELCFDNQQTRAPFQLREGAVLGDWLCFTESDPNMFLQTVPEGAKSLLIDLELYALDHIPPYDPKPADSVQNDDEKQSQSILQKIAAAVLRSRSS